MSWAAAIRQPATPRRSGPCGSGPNPPAGLQIGSYGGSGVGLSTSGDGVIIFNSSGDQQAKVSFGASSSSPYKTFDNAAGLDNTTISALSAVGTHGAFTAANDAFEIGSPGVIASAATPTMSGVATASAFTTTYGTVSAAQTFPVSGSDAVFAIVLGTGNSFSDAFWNTDKSWTNIFTAGSSFNLAEIYSSFGGTHLASDGLVAGGGTFTLSAGTLNWSAVPEPSTALAGLLLAAGLLRRKRLTS